MELIACLAAWLIVRGWLWTIRRAHAQGCAAGEKAGRLTGYADGYEGGHRAGFRDGYERGLERGARISAEHYAAELEAMNLETAVRHLEGLPPLRYRLTHEGDVLTTSPILEPK